MNKMYCFNCNKEVDVTLKKENIKHNVHGVEFYTKEKIYCCNICNEIIDDDKSIDEGLNNTMLSYLNTFGLSFDKMAEIRKSFNLTQNQFAMVMGWSNKSIVRYEKGQSLPQREYIDAYLELLMNPYKIYYMVENKKKDLKDMYNEIIERFKKNKFCKNLNLLLYFLNKKPLYKIQINKLSFFSDFAFLNKNNNKITNLKYAHAPFGPMIDDFDELINDLIQADIIKVITDDEERLMLAPNIDVDINMYLSKEELSVLDEVYKKYGNKSSKELSELSHDFIGWKETKNGEIIDEKYAKELHI